MPRTKKVKVEEAPEKVKMPKAIGPYDIIKLMFTDLQGFDKLSNTMLERNAFMINRIFAIQFPAQAQCFNNSKINSADVVRSWRLFAVKTLGFGKVPGFVYTKGAKKSSELKEKVDNIAKDLREAYCKHYQISLRDFNDLLAMTHDELIADVERFEKINSISEQNKMFSKETKK
jgi:hypothetical protein